ncbi:hypothetical protein [Cedecea sp. NFIX57]|uniref:hypothetical protein n=1 Tax=Cedecea sp. NFIX57 TaxID=1566286 RepID=UPI000A0BCB88|nr:hypothetical protein [Cedecea sp. NFIX57]SMG37495.1 hypothetical protein SAMN03159353_1008189 [Cedecea sp. NFIX57]
MHNSHLPQNHKIRVLTTIENGVVTSERLLREDEDALSLDTFIELALRAGLLQRPAESDEVSHA